MRIPPTIAIVFIAAAAMFFAFSPITGAGDGHETLLAALERTFDLI